MLKIRPNPNKDKYSEMTVAVAENDGFCPCEIHKNNDTKCMCKNFREQDKPGLCHCGRFEKYEEERK